jgi:threonine synthase
MNNVGLISRFKNFLPVSDNTENISLHEGNTPLIKINNITNFFSLNVDLYVKYEGLNPTGSFKDRGMCLAVTKAAEAGSKAIICASTGNTSASAAAYAAKSGLKAFVIIPDGKISEGKLAQAVMHGAIIIQIKGNFDDGMALVKEVSNELPVTIVNSINPYRVQGQKTAAYEIIEQLGDAPDYHCLPVGNAGNITAYWIGYSECAGHNTEACNLCDGKCHYSSYIRTTKRPKMLGYQASGSAPFIQKKFIDDPDTIATAIRIGHPQSWDLAWFANEESGGWFEECSDEEILQAQKILADQEGIFCEPASATSLAGAIKDIQNKKIKQKSVVVCTVTGHGLKDTQVVKSHDIDKPIKVDATLKEIKSVISKKIS